MQVDNLKFDKELEFSDLVNKNPDKYVHFIGIGGIGMSGLAKILVQLGYKVSGSDQSAGTALETLTTLGVDVHVGHSAANVQESGVLVISSAIKLDNPELIEAKKKNIPIVHRSQVLKSLMNGFGFNNKSFTSIGVAGTHGKTTTSGMVGLMMEESRLNPTIVVGGKMPKLDTNSKLGDGNYIVAELDESDGSIALYTPKITVISNLELDHPDHYTRGFEQVLETFEDYINRLNADSKLIINVDCPGNRQLLERVNHSGVILYSTNENDKALYSAKNITQQGLSMSADIFKGTERLGKLKLVIPGYHNISNALSVIVAGLECGVEFENIVNSLSQFTGMGRRFQVLGKLNGATIVDDYAHHPTEIITTLKASKEAVKIEHGRVIAVFQPHRYSRFANLWEDFKEAFHYADELFVCDVYAAGEKQPENITSERFSKEVNHGNANYLPGTMEDSAKTLISQLKEGDLVLTLGAGDITKLGKLMLSNITY